MHERHIPFARVFNFRDLGGYQTRDGRTVRWRRLFRSSEMQHLTADEATYAREHLGVRTVIDLRHPHEITVKDGTGPLPTTPVQYVNISLYPSDGASDGARWLPMAEDYLQHLQHPAFGAGIVRALRVIADPASGTTVFHCAAGKDRTGKLAAILLGLLGVRDEDIVRDYALSAKYMPRQIDDWWQHDPTASAYFARVPPYLYDTRPETMEDVLTTLYRAYGSMRGYVEAHGATPALMQRLEDMLLV